MASFSGENVQRKIILYRRAKGKQEDIAKIYFPKSKKLILNICLAIMKNLKIYQTLNLSLIQLGNKSEK